MKIPIGEKVLVRLPGVGTVREDGLETHDDPGAVTRLPLACSRGCV